MKTKEEILNTISSSQFDATGAKYWNDLQIYAAMEVYASQFSQPAGEYQLCPKCNGRGEVYGNKGYPGTTNFSIGVFPCDVCNGTKIIPRPPSSNIESQIIQQYAEKGNQLSGIVGSMKGMKGMKWVKVESEKDIPTDDYNQWLTYWEIYDDPMTVNTDYLDRHSIADLLKGPDIRGIKYLDEHGQKCWTKSQIMAEARKQLNDFRPGDGDYKYMGFLNLIFDNLEGGEKQEESK